MGIACNITELVIAAGSGYSDALGNSIPITLTGTFPSSLSGFTFTMYLTRDGVTISGVCEVESNSTSQINLNVTFQATDTAKLCEGDGMAQLWVTAPGGKAAWVPYLKCCVVPGLLAG